MYKVGALLFFPFEEVLLEGDELDEEELLLEDDELLLEEDDFLYLDDLELDVPDAPSLLEDDDGFS